MFLGNTAGWAELVERPRGLSISAIGLEASGGDERGAMRALLAAGTPGRWAVRKGRCQSHGVYAQALAGIHALPQDISIEVVK
jgi:hypothetical protein